jgi:hypothetical protein
MDPICCASHVARRAGDCPPYQREPRGRAGGHPPAASVNGPNLLCKPRGPACRGLPALPTTRFIVPTPARTRKEALHRKPEIKIKIKSKIRIKKGASAAGLNPNRNLNLPLVHVPNACEKSKGGCLHEPRGRAGGPPPAASVNGPSLLCKPPSPAGKGLPALPTTRFMVPMPARTWKEALHSPEAKD